MQLREMTFIPVVLTALVLTLGLMVACGGDGPTDTPSPVLISPAGTATLDFSATDVLLDPTRPYLYATDGARKRLVVYDVGTHSVVKEFPFDYEPEAIAISPANDFLYVGLVTRPHDGFWRDNEQEGYVTVIDLAHLSIDRTFRINLDPYDLAATSNGYLYVSSGSGQWTSVRGYDVATGANVGVATSIYHQSRIQLAPSQEFLLAANTTSFPSDFGRLDVLAGTVGRYVDSPYHGDYPINGNVFISPDGERVFVPGGHVFGTGDLRHIAAVPVGPIVDMAFDVKHDLFFTLHPRGAREREGPTVVASDLQTYEPIAEASIDRPGERLFFAAGKLYVISGLAPRYDPYRNTGRQAPGELTTIQTIDVDALLAIRPQAAEFGNLCDQAPDRRDVGQPVQETSPATAPSEGLAARWAGDCNANDAVGNSHGTLLGGATFAPGKVNEAFAFDGVDDSVAIANTAEIGFRTGNFTISLWVNFDSLVTSQTIFHKAIGTSPEDQEYLLEWSREDSALRFRVREGESNQNDLLASVSPAAGRWYQVTIVRDRDTNTLYFDGRSVGQQTAGRNVDTGTGGTAKIGNSVSGDPQPFKGLIDEIEVFNRALSADEIKARYAQMRVLVVNSTADTVDAHPGNRICADATGSCTLRAAIMEAEALPGADTIAIPKGKYILTIPPAELDSAATGDLDLIGELIIKGEGESTTIIDAGGLDRVIHIHDGSTVEISGVTLRNGKISINGPSSGGGIWLQGGTLTLTDSGVRDNVALNGGGGIYNQSGDLTLVGSTVSGNTVNGLNNTRGGGIANVGSDHLGPATLTLIDSTVSGNRVPMYGGGIYNEHGAVKVTGSTISGNEMTGKGGVSPIGGGGIANRANGTITLKDTIITGNHSDQYGGGIFNHYGEVFLIGSTVSGNTAKWGGGGLANEQGATLSLSNTVVSGNTGGQGGGVSNHGTISISDSTLTGNTASNSGGGLYNSGGTADIYQSTIDGNIAEAAGGGLMIGGGKVVIAQSVVSRNTARDIRDHGRAGGGVYVNIGEIVITDSTLSGNTGNGQGGGIFSSWRSQVTLTNASITGNCAADGGGIYTERSGPVYITNTIIANNLSGGDCGGRTSSNGHNLDN